MNRQVTCAGIGKANYIGSFWDIGHQHWIDEINIGSMVHVGGLPPDVLGKKDKLTSTGLVYILAFLLIFEFEQI